MIDGLGSETAVASPATNGFLPPGRNCGRKRPPSSRAAVATFVPGTNRHIQYHEPHDRGIDRIVLTDKLGFDDVPLPGGELGARLHEADLFGFV